MYTVLYRSNGPRPVPALLPDPPRLCPHVLDGETHLLRDETHQGNVDATQVLILIHSDVRISA